MPCEVSAHKTLFWDLHGSVKLCFRTRNLAIYRKCKGLVKKALSLVLEPSVSLQTFELNTSNFFFALQNYEIMNNSSSTTELQRTAELDDRYERERDKNTRAWIYQRRQAKPAAMELSILTRPSSAEGTQNETEAETRVTRGDVFSLMIKS